MENIVIDTLLYKCKDGTNNKIANLIEIGRSAKPIDHEMGISYNAYNFYLDHIKRTHKGIFIENVYTSF